MTAVEPGRVDIRARQVAEYPAAGAVCVRDVWPLRIVGHCAVPDARRWTGADEFRPVTDGMTVVGAEVLAIVENAVESRDADTTIDDLKLTADPKAWQACAADVADRSGASRRDILRLGHCAAPLWRTTAPSDDKRFGALASALLAGRTFSNGKAVAAMSRAYSVHNSASIASRRDLASRTTHYITLRSEQAASFATKRYGCRQQSLANCIILTRMRWCRVHAGVKHARDGDDVTAMKYYDEALRVDPDNVEGLVARGALYGSTGRLGDAESDLARAASLQPDHTNARKYLEAVQERTRGKNRSPSPPVSDGGVRTHSQSTGRGRMEPPRESELHERLRAITRGTSGDETGASRAAEHRHSHSRGRDSLADRERRSRHDDARKRSRKHSRHSKSRKHGGHRERSKSKHRKDRKKRSKKSRRSRSPPTRSSSGSSDSSMPASASALAASRSARQEPPAAPHPILDRRQHSIFGRM